MTENNNYNISIILTDDKNMTNTYYLVVTVIYNNNNDINLSYIPQHLLIQQDEIIELTEEYLTLSIENLNNKGEL